METKKEVIKKFGKIIKKYSIIYLISAVSILGLEGYNCYVKQSEVKGTHGEKLSKEHCSLNSSLFKIKYKRKNLDSIFSEDKIKIVELDSLKNVVESRLNEIESNSEYQQYNKVITNCSNRIQKIAYGLILLPFFLGGLLHYKYKQMLKNANP